MKHFIQRTLFILALCVICFAFLFIMYNYADNHIVRSHDKKGIYIFGNSHAMSSMDPDVLSQVTGASFTSYGSNGQSMFWAVQGMEKCIRQCPGATLLVEFTNNSISTDWWTSDNSRMLRERDKLYQLDGSDWTYLLIHNPAKTGKLMLTLPLPSSKIEGKFGINDKSRLFEDLKDKGTRILVQYNHVKEQDQKNMGYDELLELIRTYPDNRFIIVRSPMHHEYFSMLEKVNNEHLYQDMLAQVQQIPNCKTYDFGRLPMHDSCFADLDHLNYKGAGVFSRILADTLSKGGFTK